MMFVLRRLGVAPTSFRGLPPAKLVVLLRAALHGTPMNMPVGLLHRLGSSASISMRDQQTFLQLRQKLKACARPGGRVLVSPADRRSLRQEGRLCRYQFGQIPWLDWC